jgi:hypothetical protein
MGGGHREAAQVMETVLETNSMRRKREKEESKVPESGADP